MGKQTYLDSVEDYLKYFANKKRDEFIKKNPEASNREADILYNRAFELYESNESFRDKLDTEYQHKKEEVRNRHKESMLHAQSMGDPTENAYKRIDTLGGIGSNELSEISKKGHETLGPEGRSKRSKKVNDTLGPEGRKARSAKGKETLGAEGRSEISRKRIATLKKEGRLGDVIEKTVKTTKERYGEDHYSKQSKEHAVPARIESVQKRVDEDYNLVLSSLPKYFYTQQLKDKMTEILGAPHAKILDSNLVIKHIKKIRRGESDVWINENLGNFKEENTIKSLTLEIEKRYPNVNSNKLKTEKKIMEWIDTLPDTGITQDMMRLFGRDDRLRKYFDIETEVLGRTGKPIWKKCTWKKKSIKP